MARFEASVWRDHGHKGRELISAWSDHDEEKALEAAGRYAETLANEGWELIPEELPNGTRQIRATLNGETRIVTVEERES